MTGRPWYKHYPDDFLTGVVGLGPDLIGAYVIILDLIYSHGGPIPNDRKRIAGFLGCSVRMAGILIRRLINAGKLTTRDDGLLSNSRAENELKIEDKSEINAAKIQDKCHEKTVVMNKSNDLAPRGRALTRARAVQNQNPEKKKKEKVRQRAATEKPPLMPRSVPPGKPPDLAKGFDALSASLGSIVDLTNVQPITAAVDYSDEEVANFARRYPDIADMRARLSKLTAWAISSGITRPNEVKRAIARALAKRQA